MDQQELGLTPVPTGEAERNREARTEGAYYALSYRGKRVCIDSGIEHVLQKYVGQPNNEDTRSRINKELADFIEDYTELWWQHPRTGEFLEVEMLTGTSVGDTLTLTPYYKVPNDQSMGSAPLHISGVAEQVQGVNPIP